MTEKPKVLIVDDEAEIRSLVERALKKEGCDTDSARDGEEALQKFKKGKPDIALLDINLPGKSGIEVCGEIKAAGRFVPVIFITGKYIEIQDKVAGLKAGADDYLTKPFDLAELTARVRAMLRLKHMHDQVEHINYRLEWLVKERTKELQKAYDELKETQDKLIQAEKMRVVGELASGVAHEVKNPLGAVLMGAEFLEHAVRSDDKNVALALADIKSSAMRADNIIRQLLDFSSITRLNTSRQQLNHVIEESLGLVKRQLDRNHIRVMEDLKKGVPEFDLDKDRLTQVFVNLFTNAIQAMPKGGELKVSTGSWERKATVEIEDSGPGIPDDAIDKLFDPFFTTRRKEGGSGLGLSIVRSIVRLHKGEIVIRNKEKGRGARVTVAFNIK